MYIGNCIDSFDDDGDCTNEYLPFDTVSDFAVYVDENGDNSHINDLKIVYNTDIDVHHFYIEE